MSQVTRDSLPSEPMSVKGACRATSALLESIKTTGFQPICHGLIAASWYARLQSRAVGLPVCISAGHLEVPLRSFWDLVAADSLYRQVILSFMLLVVGAGLESRLGTLPFASIFLGYFVAISVFASIFLSGICFPDRESLGPIIASLAVLIHGHNPKVLTEAYPRTLRTAFPVEFRWFLWILIAFFTVLVADTSTLGLYILGVGLGSVPWLPAIIQSLRSFFSTKDGIFKFARACILLVSVAFFPFTVSDWGSSPFGGPTILFHRDIIVTDVVSLLALHLLVMSPLFMFLDTEQRVMPIVAVLCVLAWIYCAQSTVFVYPGPALVGLALVVYLAL
jgi:hypothetical protein